MSDKQQAFKAAMSIEGAIAIRDDLADKFDSINDRREAMIKAKELSIRILLQEFAAEMAQLDQEADAVWSKVYEEIGADPSLEYQVSRHSRPAVIVPQAAINALHAQHAAEVAAQADSQE